MPELINWELARQPYNWIIVALMLATGAAALCLLFGAPGATYQTRPLSVV